MEAANRVPMLSVRDAFEMLEKVLVDATLSGKWTELSE
jgi:hypothetical protein